MKKVAVLFAILTVFCILSISNALECELPMLLSRHGTFLSAIESTDQPCPDINNEIISTKQEIKGDINLYDRNTQGDKMLSLFLQDSGMLKEISGEIVFVNESFAGIGIAIDNSDNEHSVLIQGKIKKHFGNAIKVDFFIMGTYRTESQKTDWKFRIKTILYRAS